LPSHHSQEVNGIGIGITRISDSGLVSIDDDNWLGKSENQEFEWWPSSHLHVVPAPAVEILGIFVSLVNRCAVENDHHYFSIHDAIHRTETRPSGRRDASLGSNALPELVEVFIGVLPLHFPE
jgi:hypothetical protein